MPYNDLHSSDAISNAPELRPFEALPQPVAHRVNSIESAVSYITRLSAIYEPQEPFNAVISNSVSETSQSAVDISSARNNLQGVYEGV